MHYVLVFNPGSNSLKFELVEVRPDQKTAADATKLASAAIDDIGKEPVLSVYKGRELVSKQACEAADMAGAAGTALKWLRDEGGQADALRRLTLVGVRVVHGGQKYSSAVRFDGAVRVDIQALEELAPLHNQSSLDILDDVEEKLAETPRFVAFDTAFHGTLPETAWRYPIERKTADRHRIRKYGFHGLSHRYMLEQYAATVGKPVKEINLVTLHLESGCSACAISGGRSIDTTMGLTPLEGLMMGSRSGSIDPAILPYLVQKGEGSPDEILLLLNKRSGMLGIAGGTLDTRELVKRDDDAAKLALAMFSYRVRLAVGAYLAALGNAEAVLLGGGIGENSPWLRRDVCEGLTGWGLELDHALNDRSTGGQVRISTEGSRLHAWAMPVEEGLQVAYECMHAFLEQN